jgi:hypothetical protein
MPDWTAIAAALIFQASRFKSQAPIPRGLDTRQGRHRIIVPLCFPHRRQSESED